MDKERKVSRPSVLTYSCVCLLASAPAYLALFVIPPLREQFFYGSTATQVQRGVLFFCIVVLLAMAFRHPILMWRAGFRRFLLAVILPIIGAVLFYSADLLRCWVFDRRLTVEELLTADVLATIAGGLGSALVTTVAFGLLIYVPLGMAAIYALQRIFAVQSERAI